jgi:hypothetical protein
MVQVARRGASVLKRRKSRNRMDPSALKSAHATLQSTSSVANENPTPNTPAADSQVSKSESDGDVVFDMEDNKNTSGE